MTEKTLYERLGERPAIIAVVDELFAGKLADENLRRFFVECDEDKSKKVKGHVVDFLCTATGGPNSYTGREMATIHTGLNITESDWQAFEKIAANTMDKFKVPQKEREEVFTAVSSLKNDIVGL